ncbi:MAG TPA: hypothetical protein DD671_08875, partial [Balneolaceae bacterium]|nr:hypothetical protein [Balneolaceae bacterium]
ASLLEEQRRNSLELTLDAEKNAEMLGKIAAKRQEIANNSREQNVLEQESLKNSIALEKS